MEESFTGLFPYFRVLERDVFIALGLSILLAVVAAVFPAYQAGKLHVTDALRKFG
jgi:putative ABC transport system permease protein